MALVDPTNKSSEAFNPSVDQEVKTPQPNTLGKVMLYLSFLLIIPIFFYIGKRNSLIKLQIKINEMASGIDVQLKKRRDTLVKLVDATKTSMKYEKSLLTDITKLRTSKGSTNDNLVKTDEIASKVNMTFEAYPKLKATESITKLQEASEDIEREISAARRLYNSYVSRFNQGLFTWPGNIAASAMKLQTLPLFASSEADKQDVSLNF